MFSRTSYSLTPFSSQSNKSTAEHYEFLTIEVNTSMNDIVEQFDMIEIINIVATIEMTEFNHMPFSSIQCDIGYSVDYIIAHRSDMMDIIHLRAPPQTIVHDVLNHNESYVSESFYNNSTLSVVSRNPTGRIGYSTYIKKYYGDDWLHNIITMSDTEEVYVSVIRTRIMIQTEIIDNINAKDSFIVNNVIIDLNNRYHDIIRTFIDVNNIIDTTGQEADSFIKGGFVKVFHIKGGLN